MHDPPATPDHAGHCRDHGALPHDHGPPRVITAPSRVTIAGVCARCEAVLSGTDRRLTAGVIGVYKTRGL
ncbi:MAG: hypothetical protein V7603_3010 [Micromonosporaceae bacterium]